jgi:hypothetical protein
VNDAAARSRQAAWQRLRDREDFDAAFKAALLAAIEGTGLEGLRLDAGDPDTGGGLPWLQKAGSDGGAGYWIVCGLAERPGLSAGEWPTFLWATYHGPADPADPGTEILSELPFDLCLSGPGARDPRILAAITVTAVLDHQRDLTRRTA